jgi:hypothetical protein
VHIAIASNDKCTHFPNDTDASTFQCARELDGDWTGGNKKSVRFVNSPSLWHICKFLRFQFLLAILERQGLTVIAPQPAAAQPDSTAKTKTDDGKVSITLKIAGSASSDASADFTLEFKPAGAARCAGTKKVAAGLTQLTSGAGASEEECPVIIRSPEGILYYMGELIRAEKLAGTTDAQDNSNAAFLSRIILDPENPERDACLFGIETSGAESDDNPLVQVTFEGREYSIPHARKDCAQNQTLHFMSLLEELIGLQKKGSELPTIPIVRVVGQ